MTTRPSGKSIPPAEVPSTLANEYRRAVLQSLNQTEENAVELSTLVAQITEHVRQGDLSDDEHRQRVRTALHHIHLPKLEACGVIGYDADTNQVRNTTGELGKEMLTVVESYELRE